MFGCLHLQNVATLSLIKKMTFISSVVFSQDKPNRSKCMALHLKNAFNSIFLKLLTVTGKLTFCLVLCWHAHDITGNMIFFCTCFFPLTFLFETELETEQNQ